MKHITIGTRASKLAMIQTTWVAQQLRQYWPDVQITIEQIRTTGDRVTDRPLSQIGGDGVFAIEIERALREKRVDLAVHSLKDMPTAQPEGLWLTAVGEREDVRDVLISREVLPQTAVFQTALLEHTRIGTCSLRRTAQIRALYPDAHILPVRGNVDTRLRKLDDNEYDGIILASAGLHRMDLQERLHGRMVYFPVDVLMPAPGQGALAVEIRDEPELRDLIAPLQNRVTQATTTAERMFMRRLGAGCYLPIAAYGEIVEGELKLSGRVISLDGQREVRVQQSMTWTEETSIEQAERLGIQLAEQALAQGAADIIGAVDAVRTQERQSV